MQLLELMSASGDRYTALASSLEALATGHHPGPFFVNRQFSASVDRPVFIDSKFNDGGIVVNARNNVVYQKVSRRKVAGREKSKQVFYILYFFIGRREMVYRRSAVDFFMVASCVFYWLLPDPLSAVELTDLHFIFQSSVHPWFHVLSEPAL